MVQRSPTCQPPIPGGLFLQFVKSQSLRGMVQSQRRDGVGGCREAVGIYKCCGCSEIWEPYFNMCEAVRAPA